MERNSTSWILEEASTNEYAKHLLDEVDALVEDLFERRLANKGFRCFHRFMPFCTVGHARAVEDKLDELIYGKFVVDGEVTAERKRNSPRDFTPTPMECMYLVAAVRLRTLGLLWGLFKEERAERSESDSQRLLFDSTSPQPAPWESGEKFECEPLLKLLEEFTQRSERFVCNEWMFNCTWNKSDKEILGELICSYHPDSPIGELDDPADIRLKELACLLRLATCAVLDSGVGPLELRLPLKPGGVFEPRKTHLAVLNLVSNSFFDSSRSQLVIQALVPQRNDIPDPRQNTQSLPVASVDYELGIGFLADVVQDVVDSVSPILGMYPNTNIRDVNTQIARRRPRRDDRIPDSRLPDSWLLPLASARNGAEVAGMMAAILRAFCVYGFTRNESEPCVSFSDQVDQVCSVVERMHPFNALAMQLTADVRTKYDWSQQPDQHTIDKLKDHMEACLVERAVNGDKVADEAIGASVLSNTEIVVLSHYGRCTVSTLIRGAFRGEVWMLEPSRKTEGSWVRNSSERVTETLKKHGISVRSVAMFELHSWLQAADRGESVAYLTGAKGMWSTENDQSPDQFVCSQGVHSAASAVRACGGKTVMLGEAAKQFRNPDEIKRLQNRLKDVQQHAESHPWIQVEVLDADLFSQIVIAALE